MEDQLIIKKFFERSEEAVRELSDKYGALCNGIAYRILGNEQDAEECLNDAFLAVWNNVPPESPRPVVCLCMQDHEKYFPQKVPCKYCEKT